MHTSKNWLGRRFVDCFEKKQCWLNAGYLAFVYAPVMALAEAWGGVSFLQEGYSLSKTSAATAVSLIFIGWGVGGPIMGFLF